MNDPYRGSCLCGGVTFEIDAFLPGEAGNCHCSMCRKFHGAAFASLASVLRAGMRWTSGEGLLEEYRARNGTSRTFCRQCGSSLTFTGPATRAGVVDVALGAMDSDVPVKPDAHIFVGSAPGWAMPDDELPKYEEARGSKRL